MNQYSNNAGYLFGCIAYCLVGQEEDILYQEQFYARAEGHLVVTPGMIRNAFNKRVTARIVDGVLDYYDHTQSLNKPVDGTYDNFEEASAGMPKKVRSYYYATGPSGTISGNAAAGTAWHIAARSEPIEWSTYLKK